MVKIKCKKCNKEAVVVLPHLWPLCKKHYCETIGSRIRKNVRINYSFDSSDRILTTDALSDYLIKDILKDMPVKIFSKKISLKRILQKDKKITEFIKKNRINKVVIPWTADDEDCSFLEAVFYKKKKQNLPYVKLLLNTTDREIEFFARLNKIKWKRNKKDKKVSKFIDEMEKLYPQTKFSLLKSALKINEKVKRGSK